MNLTNTQSKLFGLALFSVLALPSAAFAATSCTDDITLSANGQSHNVIDSGLNFAVSGEALSGCQSMAIIRATNLVGSGTTTLFGHVASAQANGQVISATISGSVTYGATRYSVSGNVEYSVSYDDGEDVNSGLPGYYWFAVYKNSGTFIGGTQTFTVAPAPLRAGWYHIANGDTYYSNGEGQYCTVPVKESSALTTIAALNVESYAGFCWGSYFPAGEYVLPNGEIYFSNGQGATCYMRGETIAKIPSASPAVGIPPGIRNDGICAGF